MSVSDSAKNERRRNAILSRRSWLRQMGLGSAAILTSPLAVFGQSRIEPRHPDAKYINLAGNENAFGPSPRVVLRLSRELTNSSRYPWREEVVLTEMIAQREGVEPENIVLGNGCDEILSLAGAAFGQLGQTIITSDPTYEQVAHYAEKIGGQVKAIPHTSGQMLHDLDAMAAAINDTTALMYVCNPDTPSGTMLPAAQIEAFAREIAQRCPVMIDEVYLELVDDFEAETQVGLVREGLPVIIARSFSKLHGLAGHRVGYAVTTPELARQLAHYKMSSMNYLGVAAARESLLDDEFHLYSRRKIREGRARYAALLDELGLTYIPSHGNFIFHQTGIPILEFQEMTKAKGYLVGRPFEPYDDWCRVSIGSDSEMVGFARAMREIFAS